MPFGLRNASQTFQRFMHQVCLGMDFVFVYIDDLLVASETAELHLKHLEEVFKRLTEYGLTINPLKCVLGEPKLDFLSHEIGPEGILPSKERVEAIINFPEPSNVKEIQRFLGMLNYYHRFLPRLSQILAPIHAHLTTLTRPKRPKPDFTWPTVCHDQFVTAKNTLADATLLVYPDTSASLSLQTDASEIAVGAVLQQRCPDTSLWTPLGFFSRKLSATEQKYSAFDRELLAIYLAIRHFRYSLEGRLFTVYTEHKPLVYAINSKTERSPRQARHLDFVSQFTVDVQHVSGKNNVVADALSRPNDASINSFEDNMKTIHDAQLKDEELELLKENQGNSGFILQKVNVPGTELSHPGTRTSRILVKSRYFGQKTTRTHNNE